MAERAFETPRHFLDYIVTPNFESFRERPDSLQDAFNCIMSLDSLAGFLFLQHKEFEKTESIDDTDFRHFLAKENSSFGIIRDTAKSYKHIKLTRGSPIIKQADQSVVGNKPYGIGAYGVGKMGGVEVILVLDNEEVKHCLSEAIGALEFLTSILIE